MWTFNHGQLLPNTGSFLTIYLASIENSGYYECINLNHKTRALVTVSCEALAKLLDIIEKCLN